MKDRYIYYAFFIIFLFMASAIFQAFGGIIGETDDRVDFLELTDELHIKVARATAAMIPLSNFESPIPDRDGNYTLKKKYLHEKFPNFASSAPMCSDEPFYDQQVGATCSSFLVAPDILVTAGHCVRAEKKCREVLWVFDFNSQDLHSDRKIPQQKVYTCTLIDSHIGEYIDASILRLNRVVIDRSYLQVRTHGKLEDGAEVFTSGFPLGLPLKITTNAKVFRNFHDEFFTAPLDIYEINSGGPVVNANSGLVEGIAVKRPYGDFIKDERRQCMRSFKKEEGDNFPAITKITAPPTLKNFLN
ncbi:MAG: trypsin-like peptidase domain-containing protein [Bacteriovoracaceae bacterium]|nr:trypsin-like peptidase domain-containing protein [Bacteriovoracaceae bacterium]